MDYKNLEDLDVEKELECLIPEIHNFEEMFCEETLNLLVELDSLKPHVISNELQDIVAEEYCDLHAELSMLNPITYNSNIVDAESIKLQSELSSLSPKKCEKEMISNWMTALSFADLENELRMLEPVALTDDQLNKFVAATRDQQKPLWGVLFSQRVLSSISGIAALFCVVGLIMHLYNNQSVDDHTNKNPQKTVVNVAKKALNVEKEIVAMENGSNSYVTNRKENGIAGFRDDHIIREVVYDVIDEVYWQESVDEDGGIFVSKRVPRQEKVYIPEDID